MSLRAFGTRLFKHGTAIVRSLYKREYNTSTIAEKAKSVKEIGVAPPQITARNFALRNVGLQVGLHARRLFVDNVLNRVTNSLAADLRRKAARRMLFGDSGPFFALVGVSLASGTGILTKDDELEGICLEIRDAVSKVRWHEAASEVDESRFEKEPVTLQDLELGAPIAKGCSAVVYAARLLEEPAAEVPAEKEEEAAARYPLAVKMMFNYDVQSSAAAILRAMHRETVPARRLHVPAGLGLWEPRRAPLAPHPNVVAMYSVFAARVPALRDAAALYPAALPARLHPAGEGRNMSLFLVMKRYSCSLQRFLAAGPPPSPRVALLLLAQLLEGVAHVAGAGVAHRDLKADNVLLELRDGDAPLLVLADFGCCLEGGLQLAYGSGELDKGGNAALMAPEIATQRPGAFSVLDYAKADLWAAGAIAYEICGRDNPFYGERGLRSADYRERELPPLPDSVPAAVRALVANILSRNPRRRLEPPVAANVCQLVLWAPSAWLRPGAPAPTSAELLQWLLCLTTKVLCEGRLAAPLPAPHHRRTYPEYLLISSLLRRANLAHLKAALAWMHAALA